MNSEDILAVLSTRLRNDQKLPKHIQLASLTCGTLVSVYDRLSSNVIAESICSGVDTDPTTATLKGIVELIERRAFTNGRRKGIPACQTERSDGFAAFPRSGIDASSAARENALSEAIERYVWAGWWDDPTIAHTSRRIDLESLCPGEGLLVDACKAVAIKSVIEIRPKLTVSDRTVVIYLAALEPTGVISGGACGFENEIENVRYRALSELTRHALAARKLLAGESKPNTFYERRLAYFASTESGTNLADRRLTMDGQNAISLPQLQWDVEIDHDLADLVSVHRCYFENQPPFVGGELERLCL